MEGTELTVRGIVAGDKGIGLSRRDKAFFPFGCT